MGLTLVGSKSLTLIGPTEPARTYRFEMTDGSRRLIARVEAMPRNQSGADRSGRWIGSRADANAFRSAVTRAAVVPTARLMHIGWLFRLWWSALRRSLLRCAGYSGVSPRSTNQ